MAQIETSVQIAAPGELVFAFFVPQRMPYWYGAEMEACLEVQGGASEFSGGQEGAGNGDLGGPEVSQPSGGTAFHQARLFEWRFEDRYGVKGLERWELERVNTLPSVVTPSTSVRMRSDYVLPGLLGKAMDWLMTRHAVARRNQDYLLRLKRLAEHGPPE